MVQFERHHVTFIRIVGTHNTANEVFHCVHFECPVNTASYQQQHASSQIQQQHVSSAHPRRQQQPLLGPFPVAAAPALAANGGGDADTDDGMQMMVI